MEKRRQTVIDTPLAINSDVSEGRGNRGSTFGPHLDCMGVIDCTIGYVVRWVAWSLTCEWFVRMTPSGLRTRSEVARTRATANEMSDEGEVRDNGTAPNGNGRYIL